MMNVHITSLFSDKRIKGILCCLTIFFIFFLIFLPIKEISGDDLGYLNTVKEQGYLDGNLGRYNTWSSRTVIDILIMFFAQHFTLWKICNAAVLLLTVYLITKMVFEKDLKKIFFVAALYCLVPLQIFEEAGWVATSINYHWPFGFVLLAFFPFTKALKGQKSSLRNYFFAFGASVIACSQEQINICFFVLTMIVSVYLIIRKRFMFLLSGPIFVSLLNILYFLFSPGNKVRKHTEILHWFPEYSHFSFFHKLDLGVLSFGQPLFFGFNILFLLFFLALLINGYQRSFSAGRLVILSIPFIINLVFSLMQNSIEGFPNYGGSEIIRNLNADSFLKNFTRNGTGATWSNPTTLIPIISILFLFIVLVVGVYLLSPSPQVGFFLVLILTMGACSRIIMGFSPTVWASGVRTYYIMSMVIVVLTAFLIKFLSAINDKAADLFRAVTISFGLTAILLFTSFVSNINLRV